MEPSFTRPLLRGQGQEWVSLLWLRCPGVSWTNKFEVREEIHVGEGNSDSISVLGKVEEIGWMETIIRTGGESVTKVPNSLFSQEQLINLHRNGNSRVMEKLALSYDSMQQIPKLVEGIKANLINYCPELVSDWSRPFVVSWNGFRRGYLEVLVDARFNVPPLGEAYPANKQRGMEAIADAVVENKVNFATQQQQKAVSNGPATDCISN